MSFLLNHMVNQLLRYIYNLLFFTLQINSKKHTILLHYLQIYVAVVYVNFHFLKSFTKIRAASKIMEKLHSKEQSLIDAVYSSGFNSLSTFYRYQKLSKTYYNNL